MDSDPTGNETSVTSAWRKTLTHFVYTGPDAAPTGIDERAFKNAREAASRAVDPLRAVTPNSGAYWNEADIIEPNWEHNFWGMENYRKLKTIKQKYDPNGMFRVWQGVGGTRPETGNADL